MTLPKPSQRHAAHDHFALNRQIRDSDLSSSDKAILWAILSFVDRRTGLAWPSVATLARAAGLKERATRARLGTLVRIGLVQLVHQSRGGVGANGRGVTHKLRLTLDASPTRNPAPNAGFTPPSDATQPGKPGAGTRQAKPANPAPNAGEPSMHLPKEQPNKLSAKNALPDGACMDAVSPVPPASPLSTADAVKRALRGAGIRGPNLDALAASPGLTLELIASEAESVSADPNVRNKPAVLVIRLSRLADAPLRRVAKLSTDDQASIARIEQTRRTRIGGSSSEPESLGSILALTPIDRPRERHQDPSAWKAETV